RRLERQPPTPRQQREPSHAHALDERAASGPQDRSAAAPRHIHPSIGESNVEPAAAVPTSTMRWPVSRRCSATHPQNARRSAPSPWRPYARALSRQAYRRSHSRMLISLPLWSIAAPLAHDAAIMAPHRDAVKGAGHYAQPTPLDFTTARSTRSERLL